MRPRFPAAMEIVIAQTASLGTSVWGWIFAFVGCLYPYYWWVDHIYPQEPSDWTFAGFIILAFVTARLVAIGLFLWHKRRMAGHFADRTMAVAQERARIKFERKYPGLIQYRNLIAPPHSIRPERRGVR